MVFELWSGWKNQGKRKLDSLIKMPLIRTCVVTYRKNRLSLQKPLRSFSGVQQFQKLDGFWRKVDSEKSESAFKVKEFEHLFEHFRECSVQRNVLELKRYLS